MLYPADEVRTKAMHRIGIVLRTRHTEGQEFALVWFDDAADLASPMFVPFNELELLRRGINFPKDTSQPTEQTQPEHLEQVAWEIYVDEQQTFYHKDNGQWFRVLKRGEDIPGDVQYRYHDWSPRDGFRISRGSAEDRKVGPGRYTYRIPCMKPIVCGKVIPPFADQPDKPYVEVTIPLTEKTRLEHLEQAARLMRPIVEPPPNPPSSGNRYSS